MAAAQQCPLRITYLTHYFYPEGNAPASRVYEMCKRWVRDGHDVTVITGVPNAPEGKVYKGYRNRLLKREVVDGIKVVRVWTFVAANKGMIRRSLNFASFMCTATLAGLFTRRPDVLIATSPQFFCGIAGMLVRKLRRVPFVLEIRDIWPESITAVGAARRGLLIRALEWLEQRMYRSASHIVTVGDGYRDQLVKRNIAPDRISVVTNGVDADLYVPTASDTAIRQRHGLNGQFLVGYVGTIGMACGLDVVLRAAAILKTKGRADIAFALIGDGAVKEQLEAEAKRQGLDQVVFTGRVAKEEVPQYLATLDACLVHLKRKDLFKTVLPSKIFEAAAMEKPIVLGVEGCAADLVKAAGAGVTMEPENAEQLVEAAERLASDRQFAARLGSSGREYVIRHFNRDALSRDYVDVLRGKALKQSPHRATASEGEGN